MSRVEGIQKPGFSWTAVVFFFVRRKLGRVVRPVRIHALSSPSLRGYVVMEGAQKAKGSVLTNLRRLGQLRASMRVGCPF
jgi:hypothetical protein